jgi:hypothetical protein
MVNKLKAIVKHGKKGVEGLLLRDPSTISEKEFREIVIDAFANVFHEYIIFPFSYDFLYNFKTLRPDIALVKKDLSHWFIGEIEIYGHSLKRHILPQVDCFKYGQISKNAYKAIAKYMSINSARAKTFIQCIPRQILLVTNYNDREWGLECARRMISLIQIEIFFSQRTKDIVTQIYGGLYYSSVSLGFGVAFPAEKAVKLSSQIKISEGRKVIYTDRGNSNWFVKKEKRYTSLIKLNGNHEFSAGAAIQLIQDSNKNLSLVPASRKQAENTSKPSCLI